MRPLRELAIATALVLAATTARAQHLPTSGPSPPKAPVNAPTPDDDDERRGRTLPNPPSGARSDTAPGAIGTSEHAAETTSKPTAGSGRTSPKRALPDYDGRGEPPTTAGDVALWVPRVLFYPLYFVTECVIRRPLGWLITTAERKQWPQAIRDFFVFGPDKKAGVVPTAFLDFGFRASIGVYAFWDDLLGKDNHLRLHATTLGVDWLSLAIADRIPIGDTSVIDLRVEGVHRPDQLFAGFGPRAREEDRVRYGIDRLMARPVFETTWWRGSRVSTEAGVRYMRFRDDACCDDPSLVREVRAGRGALPTGFQGYTAVYQRGELTIDTRETRPADQSGFRMELEAEHGSDVRRSRSNWVRYGGSIGGYVDIKNNRTLSLSLTTLFVDPISGGEVPFTEQIILGGNGPMRGYLYGRLTDRSAAIATVKYRWPIWAFLDGTLQIATGNVFGARLDGFKPSLLRLSGAMGIESIGAADHTFELLVGAASETFASGTEINSFRLLFGTNRGF
ncbi:MAG: BamA/TamA family outer membrane protein [Labilithrix sp.]|nr:BamA/TamA family outer membrane protein [Labilithrix sp.]MCW5813823.1 BamA/TamA family outer membrane protein [Labilithrix sp.]